MPTNKKLAPARGVGRAALAGHEEGRGEGQRREAHGARGAARHSDLQGPRVRHLEGFWVGGLVAACF